MRVHDAGKDRRRFLKNGVAGLAGMAVAPSVLGVQQKEPKEKPKKKSKFVTRKLGRTGLELPVVNMGVMNSDNPSLVRAALDAGILMLDTAHYYQRGRNEEMIGQVIKDRPRESYYIATKGLATARDRSSMQDAQRVEDENDKSYMEKCEISLKRLGLDYVDILYLHNVNSKEGAEREPILKALEKLKKDGKIRFIGITTHSNEPEVIRAAVDLKIYDVVLTAYNFRQSGVKDVKKAIAEAAKAGLGVVAMKTQAGVYWDRDRTKPINMRAALKWVLQDENVHTAIPGFTTFDQMNLDVSVMEDLKLTPEESKDLDLGDNLGVPGLYCPQCGNCIHQCRERLEVPDLMRAYMYAYGYRNLACAREVLEGVELGEDPCAGCYGCSVDCRMGFDIRGKVRDIARLKTVPRDFLM